MVIVLTGSQCRNAREAFDMKLLTTPDCIGRLVESVVFRTIETHTARKWGMQW
jgi:hypothetical protein